MLHFGLGQRSKIFSVAARYQLHQILNFGMRAHRIVRVDSRVGLWRNTETNRRRRSAARDRRHWTTELHECRRKYVNICLGVPKQFRDGPSTSASYIDLYSGPGRCRIRETQTVPMAAPRGIPRCAAGPSAVSHIYSGGTCVGLKAFLRHGVSQVFIARKSCGSRCFGPARTKVDLDQPALACTSDECPPSTQADIRPPAASRNGR